MAAVIPETKPPATAMRRTLGVRDGIAIAASSTAATTSIGIGMGALALYAGRQTPALLIVAVLPILGIALSYARLNRTEPNCGNGYTWVGRSLGAWPGFLTGWVVLVASVVFMAYTGAVTGSVILQFADKLGLHSFLGVALDPGSTGVSTVIGLVALVAVTVTAVTGCARRPGCSGPCSSSSTPSCWCSVPGRSSRGTSRSRGAGSTPSRSARASPWPRAWCSPCSSSGAGTPRSA